MLISNNSKDELVEKVAFESKECLIPKLLKSYFFKYNYESQCPDQVNRNLKQK